MLDRLDIETICEDVYSMHTSLGISVVLCIKKALKNKHLKTTGFNFSAIHRRYKKISRNKKQVCDKCGDWFFELNKYRGKLLCRDCFMSFDECDNGVEIVGDHYGSPSKLMIES
jgi:hypothetical protein